jgi:hypothetical protein
MLHLDDYAMYSLKRISDMRNQVRTISNETPLSLRHEVINLVGSILMLETNLVAYVINLASGNINPQMAAFTQDILAQANWQPSWYLHIQKEVLDTIIAQHRRAEEKGHTSLPEFSKDNIQYGYAPALILEGLYQVVLDADNPSSQ